MLSQFSRSVKCLAVVLVLMALVSVLLAACVWSGTGIAGSGSGSGTTSAANVHMNDTNFVQSAVTIKKGGSVNLIDDSATPHIIENGTWDNGIGKPGKEKGAPTVQVQFQGDDTHLIGPFNTSGTFQLYCTIHPNMNLTVTVQ